MKQLRVVTRSLRVAIATTVVASILLVASAWRATHFAPAPTMSVASSERKAARLGTYRPALVSELDRAIDVDPFHPERRRPQVRYELHPVGPAIDPDAGMPILEKIELIGTVVSPGGRSFAMCRTSAGPQLVHIGEKFAGFTLKTVEQGSASFIGPDGKVVVIPVKKTGS